MAKRFIGKTALVTGGSRGFGKAIVEALIKEGAIVYALGKSQENLDKLKADIPSVNIIRADVRDWDATKLVVEKIGVVDLLVNNAGVLDPVTKFIDMDKETFDSVINTNAKAAFNIAQIVARGLISAGRPGSVVNMSSIWGRKAQAGHIAYCVSKAMMEMLTKVMALELGPHKIRVNTVNPTVVETDMTMGLLATDEFITPFLQQHPLGKFPELQDVVNATLFLLSDDSSMITGTGLPVDSGWLIN